MAANILEIRSDHEAGYLRYSSFIGQLVREGLMSAADAAVELTRAFWEKERAEAADEGIDLDAQVDAFNRRHPMAGMPARGAQAR